MNTQNPNIQHLNTHDLMEMASLDAMGLLDPEEREAFERAFRAAVPAVQAQIRREQLRFSRVDDILPQVEAPLGLKARVLAAVREAMQTMAARRDEPAPALRFPTGVSRFWRVGAIGAMAAALVLGFFALQAISASRDIQDARRNIAFDEMIQKEYGRRFAGSFMSPRTQFVSFVPATDAATFWRLTSECQRHRPKAPKTHAAVSNRGAGQGEPRVAFEHRADGDSAFEPRDVHS